MDLIRGADVVVNNFRAGVMERMGLGYDDAAEDQPAPDLRGRHRLRPHRPLRAQGRAGRAGAGDVRRDGAPLARERSAVGLRDDLRGLFGRHASGAGRAARAAAAGEDRQGQQFNVSLLDSMIAAQTQEATTQMMRGYELNWGAMPLSGVFETTRRRAGDGRRVQGRTREGHRHGARDCRASRTIRASQRTRCAWRTSRRCRRCSCERFKTNTTAHWIGKLEEQDLLCAPVRTIAEALADEQATINGMIMEAPGVVETVQGASARRSTCRTRRSTIRMPPAKLGQHTQEVLAELAQARATAAE